MTIHASPRTPFDRPSTTEAAGLRLATIIDRNGQPRDYYPHLARSGADQT